MKKRIISVLLALNIIFCMFSMLSVNASAETGNIITKMKSGSWVLYDPYAQGDVRYSFTGDSKATATYYDIDGKEYNDTFTFKKTDTNTVKFGDFLIKNTNSDYMLAFTYTRFNRSCVLIRADKYNFSTNNKLSKKYSKYGFHAPCLEKEYNTTTVHAFIIPEIYNNVRNYYLNLYTGSKYYEGLVYDNGENIMRIGLYTENCPYEQIYIETTNTNKWNVIICKTNGELVFDTWLTEFDDVYPLSWFHESVYYVAEKGYITGYNEREFGPEDKLKRQDFVVILSRIEKVNLSSYQNKTSKFSDVKKGDYYAAAVNWAVEKGIINGYQNGKFGVNDPITREQIATILYNYKKSPNISNPESQLSKFSDNNRISSYARIPLAWAVQKKIISGTSDGKLAPTKAASRAEIAAIVMNMDKKGLF